MEHFAGDLPCDLPSMLSEKMATQSYTCIKSPHLSTPRAWTVLHRTSVHIKSYTCIIDAEIVDGTSQDISPLQKLHLYYRRRERRRHFTGHQSTSKATLVLSTPRLWTVLHRTSVHIKSYTCIIDAASVDDTSQDISPHQKLHLYYRRRDCGRYFTGHQSTSKATLVLSTPRLWTVLHRTSVHIKSYTCIIDAASVDDTSQDISPHQKLHLYYRRRERGRYFIGHQSTSKATLVLSTPRA